MRSSGGKSISMNTLIKEKIVKKPWGREIWFALVPGKYLGKILEIEPNERVSLHLHEFKEETMYLFQGEIQLWDLMSDGEEFLVRGVEAGDFIHITPNQAHSMKSVGKVKAILFEVSTPHPEDSVRLKDYYGRPAFSTFDHPDDIANGIK